LDMLEPFGNHIQLVRGVSWDANQERSAPESGTFGVLRIPNVQRDGLNYRNLLNVRMPAAVAETARAKAGMILMVGSNGNPDRVGNPGFIERDRGLVFASFLMGARVKDESATSTRFAFHFIASPQTQDLLTRSVQGSTGLKNLKTGTVESLRFPAFPLPEQRRIAEILDTLDEAIRKTEQVIKKLQQMKQGLLHDLLTRGIDENGELRDPQRHPEQFKDSPLGRIPKEWEVAPFASYASTTRPFLKTGPFGSSLKGEHWVDEGVPVITIGALGEGCFTESELLFISEQKAKELAAYAVEPGDIVFSRVADVGRSVVVEEPQRNWVMSSNLMWISLDQIQIEPAFVWLNLSGNPNVRNQVRRSVNAGGREVANGGILRSLKLAWPQRPEQSRLKAVANAWQARVEDEEGQLSKLRTLKQGLMDDLLTGRVRVNVGDVPA
jgi:type I restriction enzyme S subunit